MYMSVVLEIFHLSVLVILQICLFLSCTQLVFSCSVSSQPLGRAYLQSGGDLAGQTSQRHHRVPGGGDGERTPAAALLQPRAARQRAPAVHLSVCHCFDGFQIFIWRLVTFLTLKLVTVSGVHTVCSQIAFHIPGSQNGGSLAVCLPASSSGLTVFWTAGSPLTSVPETCWRWPTPSLMARCPPSPASDPWSTPVSTCHHTPPIHEQTKIRKLRTD